MTDDPPKVISFPVGREPPKRKGRRAPIVTQPDVPHARLTLGPIFYTCPNCSSVMTITGEGLIYRVLDAYCGGCGTLFRCTNAAFSVPAGSTRPTPR